VLRLPATTGRVGRPYSNELTFEALSCCQVLHATSLLPKPNPRPAQFFLLRNKPRTEN